MNELTVRAGGHRYRIRPMQPTDAATVIDGFNHLSPTSFRRRFFTGPGRLPPGTAAELTAVDDQHLVLLAFDEAGQLAGGARAVRHRSDEATADVAVTVADAHQGRGLGSKLLRQLRREAAAAGVERFAGHVLSDNAAGQALLVAAHAVCWFDEPGVVAFEIPLGRRVVRPEIAARRQLRWVS